MRTSQSGQVIVQLADFEDIKLWSLVGITNLHSTAEVNRLIVTGGEGTRSKGVLVVLSTELF